MYLVVTKMLKRNKKNQKGATAVEFAIVIMVFILIVFGIIEFGLLMYNQHVVTNAGREGARAGVVFDSGLDKMDIEDKVREYEQKIVTFGNPGFFVDVTPETKQENNNEQNEGICINSGDYLHIYVLYNYDFLILPFNMELDSTTTMRCE